MRKKKIQDFGEKLHGARKDIWKATPSLADLSILTDDELIRIVVKSRLWTPKEFNHLPLLGVDPDSHYQLSRLRRRIHPQPVRLPEWTIREMCILYYETLIFVKGWASTLRSFEDFTDSAESLISGYFLAPPQHEAEHGEDKEHDEETKPKDSDLRLCPLQGDFLDWEGQMETVLGSKFVKFLKRRAVPKSRALRRPTRSVDEIIALLADEYHFDVSTFLAAARILQFGEKSVLQNCHDPKESRIIEAAAIGLMSMTDRERKALMSRLRFDRRPRRPAKLRWEPLDPVRTGLPERFDLDTPPEELASTLKVRGGEFGNWVPGSERSKKLRLLTEAFYDLADILGLSIDEASLGGRLGLAVGSRGRGGRNPAIAHFEPWSNVINLTRQKSDGSLCHEWAHALDLVLGRIHTANQPPTGRFLRYPFLSQEIFTRVQSHIADRKTWKDGLWEIRIFEDSPLPQEVIQPIAQFASEFYAHYLTALEAEAMEDNELQRHVASIKEIEHLLQDLLAIPFASGRVKTFVPADEAALAKISAACQEIAKAVADPATSVEALSAAVKNVVGQPLGYRLRQRLLSSMQLVQRIRFQTQSVREGTGDWRVSSYWLQCLRGKTSYWRRPEELFARAVEAFVFDRMTIRNASNTFLLSPQCGDDTWFGYYPLGVERDRFNLNLTDFFNALKKHGVLANLDPPQG